MSKFDRWIDELEEDVIQGEYGYERGEFTVYPELWRQLFKDGLTPSQAFDRALSAYDEERKRRDDDRRKEWERIQAADALALSSQNYSPTEKTGE